MTEKLALSPVKAARREKILDAAEQLFVRQGFRATTMEGIADAAAMSKATLYAYFNDKDAAFSAVAGRLAKTIRHAVESALLDPGPLEVRIARALVAKHRIVFELVRTSAFSEELFAAKDRVVSELYGRLDDDIKAMISEAMESQGIGAQRARDRARIIFAAAQGIAGESDTMEATQFDIAELVSALL